MRKVKRKTITTNRKEKSFAASNYQPVCNYSLENLHLSCVGVSFFAFFFRPNWICKTSTRTTKIAALAWTLGDRKSSTMTLDNCMQFELESLFAGHGGISVVDFCHSKYLWNQFSWKFLIAHFKYWHKRRVVNSSRNVLLRCCFCECSVFGRFYASIEPVSQSAENNN